jgi:hypothetical protein
VRWLAAAAIRKGAGKAGTARQQAAEICRTKRRRLQSRATFPLTSVRNNQNLHAQKVRLQHNLDHDTSMATCKHRNSLSTVTMQAAAAMKLLRPAIPKIVPKHQHQKQRAQQQKLRTTITNAYSNIAHTRFVVIEFARRLHPCCTRECSG